MEVPSLKYFYEPLLRALAAADRPLTRPELFTAIADRLQLDEAARAERIPSGKHLRYVHRAGWTTTALHRAGLVEYPTRGTRALTPAGRAYIAERPHAFGDAERSSLAQQIGDAYAEDDDARLDDEAPVVDADDEPAGAGDADLPAWLHDEVLATYPDDRARTELLALFGRLTRHANAHSPACWAITRRDDRLRLLVGDAVTLELGRSRIGIGVHVPTIPEGRRDDVASDLPKDDFPFVRSEGCVFRRFSEERFLPVAAVLEPAALRFIEVVASRYPYTPFSRYHRPAAVAELSRLLADPVPTPAYRTEAVLPEQQSARISAASHKVNADRIAIRQRAVAQARELVEAKLGRLTEADVQALLRLFNTDLENGRVTYRRFAPAFLTQFATRILADLPELNRWVERIWRATDDAATERVLDEFWTADPVEGAGTSLPTMLLHVREPERFAPWMPGLNVGYQRLTGGRAIRRKAAVYLDYARGVADLCRAHGISVHAMDIVLSEAGRQADLEVPAPPPAAPEPPPRGQAYDRATLLAAIGMSEAELAEIEALLREKPQIVLCGPPGTGKTFLAERLARYLAGEAGEWKLVQFHPSYGYEDFIEGIRPRTVGGGVTYEVEPGIFRTMCAKAAARPDEKFVLVIDEINRGNLPRIFGELLYLLERRGSSHSVELAASRQPFSVPENLLVIGTMNTADQSIALVDVALRRRFHFYELEPDVELLRQWLDRNAPTMKYVAALLDGLNKALPAEGLDHNLCIGHSHFMVSGLDEAMLRRIWDYSIRPTIADYFYGKPKTIAKFDYDQFVERRRTELPDISESDDEPSI